jgi:hypothetical protein
VVDRFKEGGTAAKPCRLRFWIVRQDDLRFMHFHCAEHETEWREVLNVGIGTHSCTTRASALTQAADFYRDSPEDPDEARQWPFEEDDDSVDDGLE